MFNTERPPARKPILIEIAEAYLANAQDNLYRARMAARAVDASAQYGQSGRTLNQIIAGYEEWEREALEALEKAKTAS